MGKGQTVATNSALASCGKCLGGTTVWHCHCWQLYCHTTVCFATNCVILFLFTLLFVCVCGNKYIWKHIVVSRDKTTTFRYKRPTLLQFEDLGGCNWRSAGFYMPLHIPSPSRTSRIASIVVISCILCA